MKGYYEIDFENVVDLVRVSREMKQQLFIDKFKSGVQSKLWFAAISEHGLCVLNSCTAGQEQIDAVLENIRKTQPQEQQVPEPIEATFFYWER